MRLTSNYLLLSESPQSTSSPQKSSTSNFLTSSCAVDNLPFNQTEDANITELHQPSSGISLAIYARALFMCSVRLMWVFVKLSLWMSDWSENGNHACSCGQAHSEVLLCVTADRCEIIREQSADERECECCFRKHFYCFAQKVIRERITQSHRLLAELRLKITF